MSFNVTALVSPVKIEEKDLQNLRHKKFIADVKEPVAEGHIGKRAILGIEEILKKNINTTPRKAVNDAARNVLHVSTATGYVVTLDEQLNHINEIKLHEGSASCIAYHAASNTLVTGGFADKTVKKLDVATNTVLWTFNGHDDAVIGVEILPSSQSVITASSDGTIKRLKSNGTLEWSCDLTSPVKAFNFLGDYLYVVTQDGRVSRVALNGSIEASSETGIISNAFDIKVISGAIYVTSNTQVVKLRATLSVDWACEINDVVSCITIADDAVWAGTTSGIIAKVATDGTLEFKTKPLNPFVRAIVTDAYNDLFVFFDNGIVRKINKDYQIKGYSL